MNCLPKVSVIIPVYNSEKYLRECLDSVVNQSLREIEIICIDDGSTDKSVDILEEYRKIDKRILIIKQNHLYAGVARNTGIKIAKGKYLFFMDSDDLCDKDLLLKSVFRAEDTGSEIVAFNFYRFDSKNDFREYKEGFSKSYIKNINKQVFSFKDIPDRICSAINPTPWNKICLTSFIKKYNLNFSPIQTTNDITFSAIAVALAEKITYIDETLYYYRINHDSTITKKKNKHLDDVITAVLSVDYSLKNTKSYEMIINSIRKFVVDNLSVALKRYAGTSDSKEYIDFEEKIGAIFYNYPLFKNIDTTNFKDGKVVDFFNKYKLLAINSKTFSFNAKVYNNLSNNLVQIYTELLGIQKTPKDFNINLPVVISLTSYPKRINSVAKVISSLLNQTVKVNKIVLWLGKDKFLDGENSLPKELIELKNKGLEISWNEDLGPHTKYIYAVKAYNDSILITVDDDINYPNNIVEDLLVSYSKYPYAISARRVHLINCNDTEILSYNTWKLNYQKVLFPSHALIATGVGGVLYPPHIFNFNKEIFNKENILKLAPMADDLWLKIMELISNVPVVLATKNCKLEYIENTQDDGLWHTNVDCLQNDKQLKSLLITYNKYFGHKYTLVDNIIFSFNNAVIYSEKMNIKIKKQVTLDETDILFMKKEIENLSAKLNWIQNCSKSYKIGKFITFLPRILHTIMNYYKDHGFKATLSRIRLEFIKIVK